MQPVRFLPLFVKKERGEEVEEEEVAVAAVYMTAPGKITIYESSGIIK